MNAAKYGAKTGLGSHCCASEQYEAFTLRSTLGRGHG
jgi:hypothetical protein